MRKYITLLATLGFLCGPSAALADWDATGTGSTVWSPTSISNGTSSIVIPDTEAADDWSQPLELNGRYGNTICINTDTDVEGIGAGDVTIELYWTAEAADKDDLDMYVPIQNASDGTTVTLSATVACVPSDIPTGYVRGKITTLVDEPGKLIARSRG